MMFQTFELIRTLVLKEFRSSVRTSRDRSSTTKAEETYFSRRFRSDLKLQTLFSVMACTLVASGAVIASSICLWPSSDTSSSSGSRHQAQIHARHLLQPYSSVIVRCGEFQDRIEAGRQRTRRTRRWRFAASDALSEGVGLPDLQVPREWVSPEIAAQEAEWLRGTLHQWLDDEFCPEPSNEEISRRCAKVYYYCLLEEQLDIGDILMQMVRDLETFSFKQSFHGAFSSANAAIDLITERMRAREPSSSN